MDDERSLFEGKVKIYRRNGWWHTRVHLGGKRYLRKTLKTYNTAQAEEAARKLYYETQYKQSEGLPIQSLPFSTVIDQYVKHRERDCEMGLRFTRRDRGQYTSETMLRQIKRISAFWHEYAGKRAVDAIDNKILSGYVPWRRSYYHQFKELPKNAKLNPTDKTIVFDMMVGKAIINWAHEQGYRGNKPLPTFTFTAKQKRVRPAFTSAQFKRIRAKLVEYMDATDDPRIRASRQLLHDYVITLGMSGLRPKEANELCIGDVVCTEDADSRLSLVIGVRRGKTGARTVYPHIELRPIMDRLLARRTNTRPNDLLFPMPSGSKIITLADQFRAFLKFAKLEQDLEGHNLTLYSLRHYYAINRIEHTENTWDVARNMGTSLQMLTAYYDKHALSPGRVRKLSGEYGDAARGRDDFLNTALTTEQTQHIAVLLAGFEKWLVEKHGKTLGRVHRRRTIKQLMDGAKLSYKPDDIRAVEDDAAGVDAASIRITEALSRLYQQIKV